MQHTHAGIEIDAVKFPKRDFSLDWLHDLSYERTDGQSPTLNFTYYCYKDNAVPSHARFIMDDIIKLDFLPNPLHC